MYMCIVGFPDPLIPLIASPVYGIIHVKNLLSLKYAKIYFIDTIIMSQVMSIHGWIVSRL